MRWSEIQRVWRTVPMLAVVLAGACGGGDDDGKSASASKDSRPSRGCSPTS